MMKQHRGDFLSSMVDNRWSIVKVLFVLLWMGAVANADVKATVDNPAVYRGDPVTLTLSASGDDIEFPPLTEIAGYPIESRGTSRNISIINGHTTRTIEQRLVFTPTKDVTIPSLDITVDGQTLHTLPLKVKVLEPQAAPAGAAVQMQMQLSQPSAYVGEPVELKLVLKYKPGTQIDDIKISEPKFEHFWIKRINQQAERSADAEGYITQTYRYLLFAQQPGDLQIPAIYAQIGTQVRTRQRSMFSDPFFNDPFFGGARMQYRKVFSDPVTLHVKALPQGLEVYGDFTMKSDVDKTKVAANKPVNLHIHIEGFGNVEDIPKFDPQIDNAVVYANDPEVKSYIKEGKYFGTFDQSIAIIPERDVTIKPLEFRYFDSRTKQEKVLRTHPYFITVTGAAKATAAPKVESAAPVASTAATASSPAAATARGGFNLYEAAAIFAVGFVVGGAFVGILALRRSERAPKHKKVTPMAKKIKAARKPRELFELLLPYKGTCDAIDTALEQLEGNLYRGQKHKIDRKALTACFEAGEDDRVELV